MGMDKKPALMLDDILDFLDALDGNLCTGGRDGRETGDFLLQGILLPMLEGMNNT